MNTYSSNLYATIFEIVLYFFPGGIKFSTTGICGGQIKVNYRNKWENVCLLGFPSKFKDKLCQELCCQGYDSNIEKSIRKNKVIHRLNICVLSETRCLLYMFK